METYQWYGQLIKPTWAPPSWLFGPVWTVLYILIAISFSKVAIMYWKKEIPFVVLLPFILNLVFNLIFTPIQFGLRNNLLAAVDISLVWGTLAWMILTIYSIVSWVAYLQFPYLMWVSIATMLQFSITYLNR